MTTIPPPMLPAMMASIIGCRFVHGVDSAGDIDEVVDEGVEDVEDAGVGEVVVEFRVV